MPVSLTLDALQQLGDGFHALADEVLRHNYVELRSLKPHGINAEGKPIGGTPDSYVGPSSADCTIAVEHTTWQLKRLAGKFKADLEAVLSNCSKVERVYLCTNRPEDSSASEEARALATQKGVELEVVWGEEIARTLDDQRQDLRRKHLNIPLGVLTQHSLIPALGEQLDRALEVYLGQPDRSALHGRLRRRPMEILFNKLRPTRTTGLTFVEAEAGQGKTNWSASVAATLSQVNPVLWFPARATKGRSINTAIIEAAYGSSEPDHVYELAQLLRSTGYRLLVFVDAIDEYEDYVRIQQELQTFQANSPLAPVTHLVLTCRTEAVATFEGIIPNVVPPMRRVGNERRLSINALRREESELLLSRLGATANEIAQLYVLLPVHFFGNPLYLKLALGLQRTNSLPARDGAWLEAFATQFVGDIVRRMREGGSAPSPTLVRETVEQLALAVLQDARGAAPHSLNIPPFVTPGYVGESTFLERATQSGLLVRSGERLRFCHALLCEFFAADYILRSSPSAVDVVNTISCLPSRVSLARFVVQRDASLVTVLSAQEPALIRSFNSATMDAATKLELVQVARPLLQSEYSSARSAGMSILASIATQEAKQEAVDWFNGLTAETKAQRLQEAAEFFLRLELPGAVEVVTCHTGFLVFDDEAFFSPEFSARIARLSPGFQKALADYAARHLSDGTATAHGERVLTQILAYLRDPRLLTRLRAKAEIQALASYEHRGLIHFNTDEAMEIYLSSRDRHFETLDRLEPEGNDREEVWWTLVPRQSDIAQFPHDALGRLAERELTSQEDRAVKFGIEIAEVIPDTALVQPYADAKASWMRPHNMISELVSSLDATRVVTLYRDVTSAKARRAILESAGEVPSEEVEQMLIDALDDDSLFEGACVGLAKLRSPRAGPVLYKYIHVADSHLRSLVVRALGRSHYTPALDDLIEQLLKLQAEAPENTSAARHLILAIGQIGGERSWDTLAEHFTLSRDPLVLACLLDSHDEYAMRKVHGILERDPNTCNILGRALRQRRWLHDDIFYHSDEPPQAEFKDEKLLDAVLEGALRSLTASPAGLADWLDSDAVALFDSPRVHSYYSDLADRTFEHVDARLEHAVGFARKWLARRGEQKWITWAIDRELNLIQKSRFPQHEERNRQALRTWPRELVREQLVLRLKSGGAQAAIWLPLLVEFGSPEDRPIFHAHLGQLDPEVADGIRLQLPRFSA